MYIPIKLKFILTILIVSLWATISIIFSYFWFDSLIVALPLLLSIMIPLCLAILPSIMTGIMVCGVIFDKQRIYEISEILPNTTILIAAYNEGKNIYETLEYINKQKFNGTIYTKVIDNNSKDNTKEEILRAKKDFPDINIEYIFEKKQGKFNALNNGLITTNTEYVITLDADTLLYKDALNNLVNHIYKESKNKKVGAVAGTVMVRNSRTNLLTKIQEWDYFLSIAGTKRSQGLFQCTLVAQGAFSIFKTELVKELGGWSDSIGEDIVLSWDILASNHHIHYEPKAMSFTNVPERFDVFRKQRSRWARGMVEGLRKRPFWKYKNWYAKFFIMCDYLLFFVDFGIVFFWIPGLFLALLKRNFLIVGPMTLFMLPFTFIMFVILYTKEYKFAFKEMGLQVRKHYLSFFVFMLAYNMIMSPISIIGYIEEWFNFKRIWK